MFVDNKGFDDLSPPTRRTNVAQAFNRVFVPFECPIFLVDS